MRQCHQPKRGYQPPIAIQARAAAHESQRAMPSEPNILMCALVMSITAARCA